MSGKLSKSNQSVEKTFKLIEAMSQYSGPMRLQDIASAAKIPTSTALRLVNTLVSFGYAKQNPNNLKYSLSLKFSTIADLVKSQSNLRNIAHPYLVDLVNKFKESSCLAVEENMGVTYIDVVNSPFEGIRISHTLGQKAHMHCTSAGKLFLLNYSEDELDHYIAEKGLPAITPKTKTTKVDLLEGLAKCREQGYSLNDEEKELGVRCLAAPIRDHTSKIIASINVTGHKQSFSYEYIDVVHPILTKTANDISAQLTY